MTSAPLFGIIALAITSAFAQAPPDPKFGYEVVSVRKSDPEARGSRIQPGPQGGMRTTNTSLMSLLTFAFDVRDYQILEAPSWSKSDGFDISFTPDRPEILPAPGEAGAKEMEVMMDRQRQRLQAVLRDRFHLKLRLETRELPVLRVTARQRRQQAADPAAWQQRPEHADKSCYR